MKSKSTSKSKVVAKAAFEQGGWYLHNEEAYVCARVTGTTFALIHVRSGNRFIDPVDDIDQVAGGSDVNEFKRLPY